MTDAIRDRAAYWNEPVEVEGLLVRFGYCGKDDADRPWEVIQVMDKPNRRAWWDEYEMPTVIDHYVRKTGFFQRELVPFRRVEEGELRRIRVLRFQDAQAALK